MRASEDRQQALLLPCHSCPTLLHSTWLLPGGIKRCETHSFLTAAWLAPKNKLPVMLASALQAASALAATPWRGVGLGV